MWCGSWMDVNGGGVWFVDGEDREGYVRVWGYMGNECVRGWGYKENGGCTYWTNREWRNLKLKQI